MKNGLVIADAGPIFSLAAINKLSLLTSLFADVKIPEAVWNEITYEKESIFYDRIYKFFESKVQKIKGFNELTFIMDHGESESVILYNELNADFLLVDDKKARSIATNLKINCIGTIGILVIAKNKRLIDQLNPLFIKLISNKRYYSISLLNKVLQEVGEKTIK
jgi:predicted nucleic acid-binding protein